MKQGANEIYGMLARFDDAESLLTAARTAYQRGYRKLDAYSPFPIAKLDEALGLRRSRIPYIVLTGGICGALLGYGMQFYLSVIEFPMNVGGRPFHSGPAFIPVTFELTVLCAGIFGLFGLLILCKLPMPYHPVFNLSHFTSAMKDKFFLSIAASDEMFDRVKTRQFLETIASEVYEIEY